MAKGKTKHSPAVASEKIKEMRPELNVKYMAFEINADSNKAVAKFEEKYSERPKFIFTNKGMLWLGPLPKEKQV